MNKIYSKRRAPAPAAYRYDLPREVRSRVLYAIERVGEEESFDCQELLGEVERRLLVEYGGLCAPGYEAARVSNDPAIQHFFSCDDDMALDFIELCFQGRWNCGRQKGVEAINSILQDAGIGYELTPFVEIETDEPATFFGSRLNGAKVVKYEFPRIIRKDSQFIHTEAVQPALTLLAGGRYVGANEEFLKALEHYRHDRYQECLNECLKAFESTMKIICDTKGWPYKQTDTARTLIQTCLDNGLIATYSQQQLTSLRTLMESGIPTVRNKQSGHGQGVQQHDVPAHLAQYGLHLTAATILLLVQAADEEAPD